MVKWYHKSLPSLRCGFDSRYPLQGSSPISCNHLICKHVLFCRWCGVGDMVDKNAHYLMCKGGVFYFTRHVPNDLQRHYETPRIVICLKTRNRESAIKASRSMAAKLDDFWLQMRLSHLDVPASDRLIKQQPKEAFTSSAPKQTRFFKVDHRLWISSNKPISTAFFASRSNTSAKLSASEKCLFDDILA